MKSQLVEAERVLAMNRVNANSGANRGANTNYRGGVVDEGVGSASGTLGATGTSSGMKDALGSTMNALDDTGSMAGSAVNSSASESFAGGSGCRFLFMTFF